MRVPPRRPSLLAALAASVTACGGSDSVTITPPASSQVTSVVVSPSSLSVHVGSRAQLTAVARDGRGLPMAEVAIQWTSSAPAIAQVAADGTVTGLAPGSATAVATGGSISGSASITVDAQYDLDASGVPRIITRDYLELGKVARVSRFRSGVGHDYADDVERCRSMKHYFQPHSGLDWGALVISAPMDGTVAAIVDEQTFGKQLHLVSAAQPAATVMIFHVRPDSAVAVGARVSAGNRLGTHIGQVTMSDVALAFQTPRGRRLASLFDAMTDEVFAGYQARGVPTRASLVIAASERDASPLTCAGEAFTGVGTLTNWVNLQ